MIKLANEDIIHGNSGQDEAWKARNRCETAILYDERVSVSNET